MRQKADAQLCVKSVVEIGKQFLITSSKVGSHPQPIECAIGVMAYNEEANIARVLERLTQQKTNKARIIEIIVVASGCTDHTVELARQFESPASLVRVIEQPERQGKANAINLFLDETKADLIVLVNGDTIPQEDAIEKLVEPFQDPKVGMTGGRAIPLNSSTSFTGFTVNLLWDLHDRVSRRTPKLGEIVAWRRNIGLLPQETAVDELSVEFLATVSGYKLVYQPQSVVFNRGPETLGDFLTQRRRIHAGHLESLQLYGYRAATINNVAVIRALLESISWNPKWLLWAAGTVCLEITGRMLGRYDYYRRKRHTVWQAVTSTKNLARQGKTMRRVVQDHYLLTLTLPHYQELLQQTRYSEVLQLLRQLKKRLKSSLRSDDVLFCSPKEGLFIIVAQTDEFGVEKVGKRLIERAKEVLAAQNLPIRTQVSNLLFQATLLEFNPTNEQNFILTQVASLNKLFL